MPVYLTTLLIKQEFFIRYTYSVKNIEESSHNTMADTNEDTRECEAMRKMFVGGINRDTADEAFFDYFAGSC